MNNLFFKTGNGEEITCNLCFRNCVLKNRMIGYCGVNKNSGGHLISLVYGYPSALHIDPIEKKPLYHFLPGSKAYSVGTVGCNFRCPFCQNASLSFGVPTHSSPFMSPEKIVEMAREAQCQSIAITYNEPTVAWLYFKDVAKIAKSEGLPVVMVTNGAMSDAVCQEVGECIDAVNIDLKCGKDSVYKALLKGDRSRVMKNLEALQRYGVWIELTTLLVPGVSDSEDDLMISSEEIKDKLGVYIPWHISSYHPAHQFTERALSWDVIHQRCERLRREGFNYVYPGNVSGVVTTQCPDCQSVLISREGYSCQNHVVNGCCPKCGRIVEGRFV